MRDKRTKLRRQENKKMQRQINKEAEKRYRKSKFKSILGRGKYFYLLLKENIQNKIVLQLIVTFVVCLLVSSLSNSFFYSIFKQVDYSARIDYSYGVERLRDRAASMADDISSIEAFDEKYDLKNKIKYDFDYNNFQADKEAREKVDEGIDDSIEEAGATVVIEIKDKNEMKIIEMTEEEILRSMTSSIGHNYGAEQIYITDYEGNTLIAYKSNGTIQFDIHAMIKASLESFDQRDYSDNEIYTVVYPVDLGETNGYLLIESAPKGRVIYDYNSSDLGEFLALIASAIVFIILFFFFTKNKIRYIEYLANSLLAISDGDLKFHVEETGTDELNLIAQNINIMSTSLDQTITAERKAEQAKRELITNVSHDLRTPLTSIIGYLGLVKESKYENEGQMKEFLNVAYSESEKIKKMLDDLFDYSRLSSNPSEMKESVLNISDLIYQMTDEYRLRFENRQLELKLNLSEDILVNGDPDKIHRVFDNLIVNALKYAKGNDSIEITQFVKGNYTEIIVSNACDIDPNEDMEKLFDRFYRGDKSRTSSIGGSGLGLAICKQIVNLHGGEISAQLIGDRLNIKVQLLINKKSRVGIDLAKH